jgi:AcrR family transcriptional regulator
MKTREDTGRRLRARRGEGGQLRAELVAAAEQLLVRTGDEEAVSIRAIADAVGVTPPAIYLHFPDKDALIFEVCARRFTELAEALAAATAGVSDPLDALIALGQAYVDFGVNHPEQYRILFMRRNASRKLAPAELRETAAFGHLVAAVERCQAVGALPAGVATIEAALELWSVAHGVASLMIGMPGFRWPNDFAERVLTTYVRGLTSKLETSS